jgi:mannose-6-phosphate isomerase-like protein (cupin superfamily)
LTAIHLSLTAAETRLPTPDGKRFVPLFRHGSLEVELYAPRGTDPQTPHSRDELYVVARGQGRFYDGERSIDFEAGDFLFVAAGRVHRFEDFSDDLSVWVVFYGPEGGERLSGA